MRNAALLIGFTSLVFFMGWWISDDKVAPPAQRWLETDNTPNEAYQYLVNLVGVNEPFNREIIQQRLSQSRSPIAASVDHLAELEDESLLCEAYSASCLQNQQQKRYEAHALLTRYALQLEHYQHFLAFEHFSDRTPAGPDSAFPRYHQLLSLARLQSLQWALNDNGGEGLADEIVRLRKLLSQDHSLLSKLTVSQMLSEKLQLAALLMQQGQQIPLSQYGLSYDERSLRSALTFEFRLATAVLESDWETEDLGIAGWLEHLMLVAGLRKNMTTNRAFLYFEHYADLSENPSAVIASDDYKIPSPTWPQRVRNPVGNHLLDSAFPDMPEYLYRLAHLDAQLRLLSWFRHPDQTLPNPWSPDGDGNLQKTGKEMCFPTSFNTDKARSCLPLLTGGS